jgi:ferric-dicitrate binding protein FerR (iron transport regulator)
MYPGQRFFLDERGKYTLSQIEPDLYLSWKDNVLRISNESLQDLVIRMERWYGVRIRVEEFDRVKDLRYTLTIKTESLREMLDLMKYVTPFDYQIDGENVTLNYN